MNKKILFITLLIGCLFIGRVFANEGVTKAEALLSINESISIIDEMMENGFSIIYVNDSLIEAYRIIEQLNYVEILNNDNSSILDKSKAREALALVNWKNLSYSNVLKFTNEISLRKERAFYIFDLIKVNEQSIEKYILKGIEIPEAEGLLMEAKTAFYEDRYDDSEGLLKEVRQAIELEVAEKSYINNFKSNIFNFIKKYWQIILLILLIVILLIYFFYKKLKIFNLLRKIKKMKTQKEALNKLRINNQTERFKENKISGLVYNIREKKYESKIQEIDQNLPVIEEKLKDLLRRKV
jgi:hypothetical protein